MTAQDQWSTWLLRTRFVVNSPGNPNIPSVSQAMDRRFSAEERARFEAAVRPRVESGGTTTRLAVAYLAARKADAP